MRTLPVLLLVALALPANAEVVSGQAHAVDGDTFVLNDNHVRLAGIDAPELDQTCQRDGQAWACGEEAKRQLDSMIAGQTVYCQGEGVDQYGRLLGTCSATRMNLNATMVEYGWATAYRAYSDDYLAQEHRARSAKAGIWRLQFAFEATPGSGERSEQTTCYKSPSAQKEEALLVSMRHQGEPQ